MVEHHGCHCDPRREKGYIRPEEQQSTDLPIQLLMPTDPTWKQVSTI
jgi:hypothetical protein